MLSLCMIVKDEEALVERAIASAEGLADEIVVTDTGSTDDTIPILHKLGAVVVTGADRMNKGESRNRSIDAASGEWVIFIDADEMLTDPIGLREFLEETYASAVYIPMVFVDAAGKETLSYPIMRVFRRGAYRYKYRCHEVPIPVNGWGKVAHYDKGFEHRPPPERVSWKPKYYLDRLLLDVKENPGDARPLYYLGRQYMYAKEWDKSIETLNKYLATNGSIDRADAWFCISQCHKGKGEEKEQIAALYLACATQPKRRRWWGNLAEIYHANGEDELAIGLLKCALEIPEPTRTYAHKSWYGAHIYDLLARCCWKRERIYEGRANAERALFLDPDNERLKKNLWYFQPENGRLPQLLDSVPEISTPGKLLYVGANRMRSEGMLMLHNLGHLMTLLEIFPDNAEYYRLDPRLKRVICGDVREVDQLLTDYFDVIFWWHGPEHVDKNEAITTIRKLEEIAGTVILATPNGYYLQPPIYGNDSEEHVSSWIADDFEILGYDTAYLGAVDQVGSHVLAWKRVNSG